MPVRASVIIPAGGSGTRFGASLPKQFLTLCDVPILVRTLRVFEETACIEHIVIAASADFHEHIRALCKEYHITKCTEIVPGGTERQYSIRNALNTASIRGSDVVLVHDAVRPFITPTFITEIAQAALERGSAVPGLVPKDTIKEVHPDGSVSSTPERSRLRAIQTPQGFRREELISAYARADEKKFLGTDDASVLEFAGATVYIVEGLEQNIKITTPLDFSFAELLLKKG